MQNEDSFDKFTKQWVQDNKDAWNSAIKWGLAITLAICMFAMFALADNRKIAAQGSISKRCPCVTLSK